MGYKSGKLSSIALLSKVTTFLKTAAAAAAAPTNNSNIRHTKETGPQGMAPASTVLPVQAHRVCVCVCLASSIKIEKERVWSSVPVVPASGHVVGLIIHRRNWHLVVDYRLTDRCWPTTS